MSFGNACSDGADADFTDELYADACCAVGVFQVVNQLSKVLDRVNVVVRRRGNESHARRRVTGFGDPRIDFSTRKLTALTRLSTLCQLDLQLARLS